MHKGVDFAVPDGTPVMAAGFGTIQIAGRVNGYGNFVLINHGNGYSTAYGHLSRFAAASIKVHACVKAKWSLIAATLGSLQGRICIMKSASTTNRSIQPQ